MRESVVVSGFGVVSAYGLGTEGLEAALAAGRPRLSAIDRSAGYHRADPSARMCLRADIAALAPWLQPAEGRRMSPPSKLAVTAARQALAMAGLATPEGRVAAEPEGDAADPALATAVVLANSFGPSSFTEHLMRQILLESPEAASPFYFTECVANAPAAQIAIAAHARGANITVVQREAGPLLAVAKGAAEVASGRARRALVGAAEEMTPLLHSFLDRFSALSRGVGEEGEVARPFDRRRDGFLAAEGAVVLVLEREADALARKVRPLARIAGWASAFDPTAPPTDWGHGGPALARGLLRGLARFGLAPADFDRIVSGASGAVAGDRLEASVLRSAWGERALPPILVPKGVTGEYGGGFLTAALLAVCGKPFGPTAGFAEADPELSIVPHDGRPLPPPRRLLATSLAAGGAATWLALESTESMVDE
ncbi:MAG TPA: beta-ketoacyl synthase N-terminal-like domain-containing protein [Thermoanaerobaculia bacterium]|nr:beta-ketoacyl synthase N-terminal-like domain-containing protein [Thermoanaerobaculia bacterium]